MDARSISYAIQVLHSLHQQVEDNSCFLVREMLMRTTATGIDRQPSNGRQKWYNLFEMLHHFRDQGCHDPRDKVYGLLSLLESPSAGNAVKVDYNASSFALAEQCLACGTLYTNDTFYTGGNVRWDYVKNLRVALWIQATDRCAGEAINARIDCLRSTPLLGNAKDSDLQELANPFNRAFASWARISDIQKVGSHTSAFAHTKAGSVWYVGNAVTSGDCLVALDIGNRLPSSHNIKAGLVVRAVKGEVHEIIGTAFQQPATKPCHEMSVNSNNQFHLFLGAEDVLVFEMVWHELDSNRITVDDCLKIGFARARFSSYASWRQSGQRWWERRPPEDVAM